MSNPSTNSRGRFFGYVVTLGLAIALSTPAIAQTVTGDEQVAGAAATPTRELIVATKHSPPFAIKNADGSWTGISVELWKHLCGELNLAYELREMPLESILDGLANNQIDAGVAAISVTAERHERIEFCHPHYTTGLGIAVPVGDRINVLASLRRVLTPRLLTLVASMIVLVLVCGLLFWLFERKRNETMFGGNRRRGLGMGVWWSTILLLGHKGIVPVSTWGRILAGLAMLTSIGILSLITGVIASVLTIGHIDLGIGHPSDLRRVRVATIEGSTSADYLRQRRISYRGYQSPEMALVAAANNECDAVVYDEAILKYFAHNEFQNRIEVLPFSFNTQDYAIALRPASELRKPLNEELLRYRASDAWNDLLYRFLGDSR